ncbi:MAG: hypothetical protein ABRQ38_11190 [Candidatus Eremiobacterota bacterium]
MKKNKLYLVLSMFIALMLCLNLFAGCGSGTGSSANSDWPYSNTPSQLDQTGIKIRLSNIQLPDLGVNNGTYELWAKLPGNDDVADDLDNVYPFPTNDDSIVSLGKFVVTPNGKLMDPSRTILFGTSDQTAFPVYGQTVNVDLSKAYRVYLSIEPAGEDFSDPTIGAIIMYGIFSNRVCPMTLYAAGTNNIFIPTQDFASDNVPSMVTLENAGTQGTGIWFKNGAQNYKGLYLPTLITGGKYKYEAWVRDVNTGTYYSLGKFTNPEAAEQLNALTYSTMNPAGSKKYPYPGLEFSQAGQNPGGFVTSALNLANGNYRAYITLEPNPDNDTSQPFIFVMESGYPNPQPAVAPYQYLPSTLLGSAFNGGTQPMIRMITEKHKTDSDQFIFLDDIPLTKATLE